MAELHKRLSTAPRAAVTLSVFAAAFSVATLFLYATRDALTGMYWDVLRSTLAALLLPYVFACLAGMVLGLWALWGARSERQRRVAGWSMVLSFVSLIIVPLGRGVLG